MNLRWTIMLTAALATMTAGASLAQEAGQKAFMDAKCNRCHSISSHEIEATVSSEKMRGPDLAKVGTKHDAAWITQYVKREVKMDDKNHRMAWKGSDEDLKTIADWLATLK
jgi:mono/diheme cytochrome c family protein